MKVTQPTLARGEAEAVEPLDRPGRLFEQLSELCLSEGFLHLTTDEIARRLRCSKTTLYQIAPNREALYGAVVDRYLESIRDDGVRAALEATDYPGALVALLEAGITAARRAAWECVRDMRLHPASRQKLTFHHKQRVQDVEAVIEAGVKAGAFQGVHAHLIAELILAIISKVFEPELLANVGLSLAEAYAEAYRMVEFGLLSGPQGRAAKAARKPQVPTSEVRQTLAKAFSRTKARPAPFGRDRAR